MDGIKSRQLKMGLCGLAAMGLMLATQGCSSSSNSGTGGSTGSGGKGGAAGGQGGAIVDAGPAMCGPAVVDNAPASGLIADFMGDGGAGVEIMGGFVNYGGAAAPTVTSSGGVLHIVENAPALATPQYVGAVVYFNDCVDASGFTGVQFSIMGTLSGCTMQYSTNDSAHSYSDGTSATDPKGTGPMGSYAPQAGLTSAQFSAMVQMPFAGTGAPSGGSPATAVDPKKLTGVQWQFTIAAAAAGDAAAAADAGSTNCTADLMIDDIKFYH